MKYRHLGASGLRISEITFGNWLTHGSQLESDAATACVYAALDAGITTFDTADMYANTAAESVLGDALKGQRRESMKIFTKAYFAIGPGGPNDFGVVPQAPHGIDRRLTEAARHRLCRPLSGAPLEHATPLEDDGRVRGHRPQRARRCTSG